MQRACVNLADSVYTAIQNSKTHHAPKQTISFIRAGQKARLMLSPAKGLLTTAWDWQLKFPDYITTSVCLDVVLTSESSKQVVLLELTVPWEDGIEEANEHKRAKYVNLTSECQSNG